MINGRRRDHGAERAHLEVSVTYIHYYFQHFSCVILDDPWLHLKVKVDILPFFNLYIGYSYIPY